eukprot:RCo006003
MVPERTGESASGMEMTVDITGERSGLSSGGEGTALARAIVDKFLCWSPFWESYERAESSAPSKYTVSRKSRTEGYLTSSCCSPRESCRVASPGRVSGLGLAQRRRLLREKMESMGLQWNSSSLQIRPIPGEPRTRWAQTFPGRRRPPDLSHSGISPASQGGGSAISTGNSAAAPPPVSSIVVEGLQLGFQEAPPLGPSCGDSAFVPEAEAGTVSESLAVAAKNCCAATSCGDGGCAVPTADAQPLPDTAVEAPRSKLFNRLHRALYDRPSINTSFDPLAVPRRRALHTHGPRTKPSLPAVTEHPSPSAAPLEVVSAAATLRRAPRKSTSREGGPKESKSRPAGPSADPSVLAHGKTGGAATASLREPRPFLVCSVGKRAGAEAAARLRRVRRGLASTSARSEVGLTESGVGLTEEGIGGDKCAVAGNTAGELRLDGTAAAVGPPKAFTPRKPFPRFAGLDIPPEPRRRRRVPSTTKDTPAEQNPAAAADSAVGVLFEPSTGRAVLVGSAGPREAQALLNGVAEWVPPQPSAEAAAVSSAKDCEAL